MYFDLLKPADGSRLVRYGNQSVLIGQPPEVLKGLLLLGIGSFDTLVLADIKEKDGSLLNNVEFPLYYFLFMGDGLKSGRKLNLVGDADDIGRILRLLRLTLLGPTQQELDGWLTEPDLVREWLAASNALALKDAQGRVRNVESYFNVIPFNDQTAQAGGLLIRHLGTDRYEVRAGEAAIVVDLNEDVEIRPPYSVQNDFVPRELTRLGLEILGSASGFSANEPCTGLALCHNGDYILIDSIPYLDKHLFARGISKNQISAVFLSHLHDDHCALFPLILMPGKVDVITTREIFNMAMDKLSCHLNWRREVIEEYFNLFEVMPGRTSTYYGLEILPHITVHSIPTIGATFSSTYKGLQKRICVIGDNHGMSSVFAMAKEGVISSATCAGLKAIYQERYDLLVADGGAGAIHGDPADALHSDAERVVFVHVEHLSNRFNTTFSLASSGKRYTVLDGDPSIHVSLMNHYLSTWLGEPLSNRWARSILAEEEIRRYNAGDVIMVQESRTRGYVFLILTGYCEVVTREDDELKVVAQLQAGEIIGEMAVITGTRRRNASVVASSPVTLCVFQEETFNAFITSAGYRDKLLSRWRLRQQLRQLPQFAGLLSTVLEKLAHVARIEVLEKDCSRVCDEEDWYLLASGQATFAGLSAIQGDEFGALPFASMRAGTLYAEIRSELVSIPARAVQHFLCDVPQFSYLMRKYRSAPGQPAQSWLLGKVSVL
jgi:CRP-like cAMP-binding protein